MRLLAKIAEIAGRLFSVQVIVHHLNYLSFWPSSYIDIASNKENDGTKSGPGGIAKAMVLTAFFVIAALIYKRSTGRLEPIGIAVTIVLGLAAFFTIFVTVFLANQRNEARAAFGVNRIYMHLLLSTVAMMFGAALGLGRGTDFFIKGVAPAASDGQLLRLSSYLLFCILCALAASAIVLVSTFGARRTSSWGQLLQIGLRGSAITAISAALLLLGTVVLRT